MGGQFVLALLSGIGSLIFSPIQTVFAVIFQPIALLQFLPLFLSYWGVYP